MITRHSFVLFVGALCVLPADGHPLLRVLEPSP
jgi:hypothetical protein